MKETIELIKEFAPLTLPFHYDAGHGWLEAPKALVDALEVVPTSYSYQTEDRYYLEEDCDAGQLIEVLKAYDIAIYSPQRDNGDRSFIRGLRCCKGRKQ
jgi:hypothetical protein